MAQSSMIDVGKQCRRLPPLWGGIKGGGKKPRFPYVTGHRRGKKAAPYSGSSLTAPFAALVANAA